MKVQSINSNYTYYNNHQNRKANADNLSFGTVKLGPSAIEVITDAVTNGNSNINAAENLKKALNGVKCDLKGAFRQYLCSAHNLHSKFAEEAEKYLSKFKNPEDVELVLDLTEMNHVWGREKLIYKDTNWPATNDYQRSRRQYLGKTPCLYSPKENGFVIGEYSRYNENIYKNDYIYKYDLEPNIIIDEVGGLSERGEKKWDGVNRCYHQEYKANYIVHDVVAQLADLLNGLEAKCYDALRSVPYRFNEGLFREFPEKTHTEQARIEAREQVRKMLSE